MENTDNKPTYKKLTLEMLKKFLKDIEINRTKEQKQWDAIYEMQPPSFKAEVHKGVIEELQKSIKSNGRTK